MTGDVTSPGDQALITLDRLRRHLNAVTDGSHSARDDLAVSLHLLVGEGDGYDVLSRALDYLKLDEPTVAGWSSESLEYPTLNFGSDKGGDLPTTFALRATAPEKQAKPIKISALLRQECVRFAVPGFEPKQSWTWSEVIRKVRNKFGGHVDPKPPGWLEELRYYPVTDTDAVTFLLWSIGQAVMASASDHFCKAGLDIRPYTPTRFLGGVALTQVVVAQEGSHVAAAGEMECKQWRVGYRRAIVGARYGDCPFIFGLEGDARLSVAMGEPGMALGDFERDFKRREPPRTGPNRKQRRVAQRRHIGS